MEQVIELLSEGDNSSTPDNTGVVDINSNIRAENQINESNIINNTETNTETLNTKDVPHETIFDIANTNETQQEISTHNNTDNGNNNVLTNISRELSRENTSEIPTKIVKYIDDGKLNIKDVKQLLNDSNIGERLSTEQKAEIFKSEPFKSLIKNTFQNRWTLTPQDIAQDGKVGEFYEKLARETSRLSKMINEAINESGQSSNNVQAHAAANMSENIEFMNQVNHMMNYVQLPIKLTDSQAHGDLYVYTNKKNLARKDGMLTAFLHLDMENLGSLDISIALQTDRNQVTTKFYLDEDIIPLIEEHKDELISRLSNKGYQCKAMLLEKDDDKTVLEHIEEQVSGQNALISYQNFDIRA
jgi:hypothetical protein